jgi:hypothetical protein
MPLSDQEEAELERLRAWASLRKGFAVAGIWLGVGIAAFVVDATYMVVVAICALAATIFVWKSNVSP